MSNPLKHPTLVVTGITGFLGSHMALEALRRGHHVRGTLRRMERADHVQSVLSAPWARPHPTPCPGSPSTRPTCCPQDGWTDIVAGADAVLHVASPFLGVPKQESDLVEPARKGGSQHVLKPASTLG